MQIQIGPHTIGENYPTYFIADISANHDGDLERAKALIRLAKEAGFRVDFLGATFHSPRVLMVSLARLIDWIGNPRLHSGFVNSAGVFERLSNWPTRFLTGHMIVISARKLE